MRADPFGPHRRSRSHSRAPAEPRAPSTLAHTLGRAPATLARTLPRRSLPGLRLGPRSAAPRRRRRPGCQQLLPSAVQQPRPPAGPPRAPAGGIVPGRWPCSRLACSPGRSEDGRVAVSAASPSQRPEPGGFRGYVSAPPGRPGGAPVPPRRRGYRGFVSARSPDARAAWSWGWPLRSLQAALNGFTWWLPLLAFSSPSGMSI